MIPLFVSIPHSGAQIPPLADWLKNIEEAILKQDLDAFVDDLYQPALIEHSIPSVFFKWHRYSVDVNRFSTDISHLTVEKSESLLKEKSGCKGKALTQNKAPSDIHWHQTTKGDQLITKPLSKKKHEALIRLYFAPFHREIKDCIEKYKKTGYKNIYLLDLHSMPSQGLSFHRDKGEKRKDIVISDNEGCSCSKQFRDLVVEAYQRSGFEVALNWPYKGGAITQTYGRPALGQHCLQVELNRRLYMDEKTKRKNINYTRVQTQLKKAIAFIMRNQDLLKDRIDNR